MSNQSENLHLNYLKECIGKYGKDKALSPLSKWLNGKLEFAEEGHLKVSYIIRDEWINPFGTFHGGMAAAIIDDIIGTTVYSLGIKEQYSTVNLSIDYLSFALPGDEIIIESKIVRKGIAIMNAEAMIYKRKKILVKASSNLVKTGKSAF
ncbi:MAG: PaaI family thioesterase [Bacteroidia bacterium]